ncbi:DNA modification methylase [Syntrophus gentianae]|uniref:site-specific DNA-methyltransferase (adenine-specific) n=1 Tax=Syntrophus gentianae TaxID=43775 RepID=A0A1H8BI55_9BACT|nr:site-specific DNA-methyltransferase [Syntrophus gentianae]SEM82502.1 DNA modification methylase [Syntrophus gentianae]
MIIEVRRIDDLIPAEKHPRKMLKPGDEIFEDLRRSIETFGYVDPIIWNSRTHNIVGGHQRLEVLKHLGHIEAEVSIVDLDPEMELALDLALNKISGDWDMPKLKDVLIELETLPVDLNLTGYSAKEIELLLKKDILEDDFDAAAEAEKIESATSKRGDIWQLGRHRLMCGDSTIADEVKELMNGSRADMVFTDPPYNVNYGSSLRDRQGKKAGSKNAGRKILNEHFAKREGFYEFLRDALAALRPHVSGDVYIAMSSSELDNLQRAFRDAGGHFSTFIIWVKSQFTIGRANYQRQYEPILYGWFEGSTHYWSGVRNLADVYGQDKLLRDTDGVPLIRVESCAIDSDVWEFPKPVRSDEHPTMKPIALVTRALRNSSKPGALVLDSFSRSGTTIMAAEQTGRTCYAMELSPVYCDVDIKRWETFTGGKAELIQSGSS